MNADRIAGMVVGIAIGVAFGCLLTSKRAERRRQFEPATVLEWNEQAAREQFRTLDVGELRIVRFGGHEYIAGEGWAKHADNCAACTAGRRRLN